MNLTVDVAGVTISGEAKNVADFLAAQNFPKKKRKYRKRQASGKKRKKRRAPTKGYSFGQKGKSSPE